MKASFLVEIASNAQEAHLRESGVAPHISVSEYMSHVSLNQLQYESNHVQSCNMQKKKVDVSPKVLCLWAEITFGQADTHRLCAKPIC